MYEQIKEILERYDVYDFEIEGKTIADNIEILDDTRYEYNGYENSSYDVQILSNISNAMYELAQLDGGETCIFTNQI